MRFYKRIGRVSILLIVFLLSLLCLSHNTVQNVEVSSADNSEIKVSVKGLIDGITDEEREKDKTLTSDKAYPDIDNNSKNVVVKISLSRASTENVVVSFRTYDCSALTKSGDYTAIENKHVFAPGETSYLVTIQCKPDGFAVKFYYAPYEARFFFFQVYKVEGTNVSIDNNNSQVRCYLPYDYAYQGRFWDKNEYYLELSDNKWYGTTMDEKYRGSNDAAAADFDPWSNLGLTQEYYTYYENILTNMYVNVTFDAWDGTNMQSNATYRLLVGDTEVSWFEGDNYFGGVKPFSSDCSVAVNMGKTGSSDCVDDTDDYEDSGYNKDYDGKVTAAGNPYLAYMQSAAYRNHSELGLEKTGTRWYYCPTNEKIHLTMYKDTTDYFIGATGMNNVEWSYCVYDLKNPEIIGWYATDVVYDLNHYVYLSVRYSEPVQVNTEKSPQVVCQLNSDYSGVYATFDYYCGSYSDTLVFRCDMSKVDYGNTITKLIPVHFNNSNNIYDMCTTFHTMYKYSSKDDYDKAIPSKAMPATIGKENCKMDSLSYDVRVPVIESASEVKMVCNDLTTKIYMKSNTFDTENGDLYYCWSNDVTNTDTITRESSYKLKAKNNSEYFEISASSLTGVRFLWLKAVSPLGKTDYKVVGPYYFDNVAESATIDFVDDPTMAQRDKTITLTIDYSANCYAAATVPNIAYTSESYTSALTNIDLVWSYDQDWNENTTYYYNTGDPTSNYRYWNSGKMGSTVTKKVLETVTKKVMEFGIKESKEFTDDGKTYFSYSKNSYETDKTVTYVTKIQYTCPIESQYVGIAQGTSCEYRKFYLGVKLTDALGNYKQPGSYDYSTQLFYMDARNIFPGYWEVDSGTTVAINDTSASIYNIQNFGITFTGTSTEDTIEAGKYEVVLRKPSMASDEDSADYLKDGTLTTTKLNELFTITLTNNKIVTIEPKTNASDYAGFYQLCLKFPTAIEEDTKYTETVEFYLVNKGSDFTFSDTTHNYTNVSTQKYLINKVYSIDTEATYYYKDALGSIQKEKYAEKSPLSFSSKDMAKAYLTYMEYQDLYLVQIKNKTMASNLNNNSSGYIKAVGFESRTAEVGDYWIRYKRSTWVNGSSTDASWCYYFYSSSESTTTIDIQALNIVLETAIEKVVENIMLNYGNETYLNTSFGLDDNGSPYLDPSAIKADLLKQTASRSGTAYADPIEFSGDSAIYSNNISTETLGSFQLASTYELDFTEHTIIYLAENVGSKIAFKNYIKVDSNKKSLLLKDLVATSGVYRVLEIDEYGAKTYDVYIDKDAPTLKITYKLKTENTDSDGNPIYTEKTVYTDSSATEYSYYGVSCVLDSITDEMDDYAYICIYTISPNEVYASYTRKELKSKSITLGTGKYKIEVFDRSGNYYTISMYLNDTELNCTIKEVKNSSITFKVNDRTKNDIYRYEIYWGNDSSDTTFEESKKFTDAGIYEFYVEDWYGNVYQATYEFIRETPELTWRYEAEDGAGFTTYNPNKDDCVQITSIGSQIYGVTSSKRLGFIYDNIYNLEVEVLSGSVKFSQQSYGANYISVEFNLFTDFSIKVYYHDYPEIYAIYHVIADGKAPDILATYNLYTIYNLEDYDVEEQVKETVGLKEGMKLSPTTIGYLVKEARTKSISQNNTISTNSITMSFEDASGVKLIRVLIDGVVELETTDTDAAYTFDAYGKYVIEAYDSLGNKALLNFTNSSKSRFSYTVDGVSQDVPLSSIIYFNEDNTDFSKKEYGHNDVTYAIPDDATISFLIKLNDKSYYFCFDIKDGEITRRYFTVEFCYDEPQYDDEGKKIAEYTPQPTTSNSEVLLSTQWVSNLQLIKDGKVTEEEAKTLKTYSLGNWAAMSTIESEDISILAQFDKNYNLYFKVEASNFESDVLNIQTKIQLADSTEPFFSCVGLSKTKSNINLENEDGKVETNTEGNSIFTNGTIIIDTEDVDKTLIKEVVASYSTSTKFKDFTNIYANGEFIPYTLQDEGFYQIKIMNVYNNETIYTIALSNKCMIISEMIYRDNTSVNYTNAYEENNLYSNYKAIFQVYSEGFAYTILKDGVAFSPSVEETETFLRIELEGDGYYTLHVRDQYGNHYEKYVEIEYKIVTVGDDLVTGFNEKALMLKDGYTNQKLSIDQSTLELSEFNLIYVYKDDELVDMVYDLNSEEKVPLNSEKLLNCIGSHGDGTYSVTFRDKYGNLAIKEYHYSSTPTLEIYRQSRTDLDRSSYSVDKAIEIGVYSNNVVTLLSNSICYTFSVDGTQNSFPYKFEFVNSSINEGSRDFKVYYLDEYGFEYNIDIHLLRTTIKFNDPTFKVVELNGEQFTQDNITLTYGSDYTCSYILNGDRENPIDYASGDICNDDGVYNFTLIDIAGNVDYFNVTKDTLVLYTFKGTVSGQEFESSSVAMNEEVYFNPNNSDTAKIKQVYLDGVLQEGYTENTFSKNGKWEIEIQDDIGNTSVYVIYLIQHEMNHFAYTCPKNYQITDVRYDNGNGQKLDYLPQVVNYQSFDFSDEGSYVVTLLSLITGEVTKFQFEISLQAPTSTLNGVEDGGDTITDVTFSNSKKGDVYEIYKDGELVETYTVENDGDSPTISDHGDYKVIVTNLAGNQTTFEFTRKFVPNTASSALLIIALVVIATGLFVAVIYRNKSKVDK